MNICIEMETSEIMNKGRSCWSRQHWLCPLMQLIQPAGRQKDWTKDDLNHTLTHTRGCESERKARAKSEELIEVVCFTAGSLLNAMSPLGHGE